MRREALEVLLERRDRAGVARRDRRRALFAQVERAPHVDVLVDAPELGLWSSRAMLRDSRHFCFTLSVSRLETVAPSALGKRRRTSAAHACGELA